MKVPLRTNYQPKEDFYKDRLRNCMPEFYQPEPWKDRLQGYALWLLTAVLFLGAVWAVYELVNGFFLWMGGFR